MLCSTSSRGKWVSLNKAGLDQGSRFQGTVTKLVVDAGKACAGYQDRVLRNLPCKRVQLDEIWNFVYAKRDNLRHALSAPDDAGDVWTWTAIDADSKLLCTRFVGGRDLDSALAFTDDLKERLANRVQLTSDGHRPYAIALMRSLAMMLITPCL